MNKSTPARERVPNGFGGGQARPSGRLLMTVRTSLFVALCAAPSLFAPTSPRAQQQQGQGRERGGARVTGVNSTRQGDATTVSISGDGPMGHVQTWQDKDGFHVVYPNGKGAVGRMSGGVRAERIGDSLELIIPTRPGASVTVQPRSGRLDLVVAGGLEDGPSAPEQQATPAAPAARLERVQGSRERADEVEARRAADAMRRGAPGDDPYASQRGGQGQQQPGAGQQGSASSSDPAQPAATTAEQPLINPNATVAPTAATAEQTAPDSESAQESSEADASSSTSMTWLLVLGLGAGGGALFYVRRRRAQAEGDEAEAPARKEKKGKTGKEKKAPAAKAAKESAPAAAALETFELPPMFEPYKGDRRKRDMPVANDRRKLSAEDTGQRFSVSTGGALKLEAAPVEKPERRPEPRGASQQTPAVLFGAYRIDQEIGKLVQGLPHSVEVLASRATDDRRAIETSLVKALNSDETGEDGRARVRRALEDYGFVARQSAALLLSTDSYERVTAARLLGQMQSRASFPFLLEALFDPEPVVRTEVVSTLGSLGMPRAIGALIDLGRRYPELPSSLLAPALTACSFEALEWSWETEGQAYTAGAHTAEQYAAGLGHERTVIDAELPEWLEDGSLADALERLESADFEARVSAATSLGQFPARRSVEALTAILVRDENPAVRAAAVTSLGAIDHESVYAPVLFALADEAREVRAAAARAYSSVNFDRADAVNRLVETADPETLEDLAQACVKSGLAAQSVGRLSSDDRRQAYEAFALLSLVVKGGQSDPILDAVGSHCDPSVQMAATRLACLSGEPRLLAMLRELVTRGGLPQGVRAAILEAVGPGAPARH